MIFTLIGSIALTTFAALLAKLIRIAIFSTSANVPRASSRKYPWLPFGLGAAIEFGKNPLLFLKHQRRMLGDVFKLNVGFLEINFIFGINAQTTFLRAPNDLLSFNEAVEALMGKSFGNMLVRDTEWSKLHNTMIAKWFMKPERQPSVAQIAAEVGKSVVQRWPKDGPINLFKEVSNIVLTVSMRNMVGERVFEKYGQKLIPLYQQFEEDMVDPLSKILPNFVPIASRKRIQHMFEYVSSIIEEETKLRFEEMKQDKEMPNDYLQFVIKETGDRFVHVFGSHLMLVIMAAHTNTAGTTAWTLAQIYSNPILLGRVRNEIAAAIGKAKGHDACRAACNVQMPIMNACLWETGRLYSGTIFLRKSKTTFDTDGVAVPPECIVATYPRVSNDDIHIDSDKYIPERWLPGTTEYAAEEEMRPPSNQIVHPQFGAGRHPCLGERFAMTVMTSIWVSLVSELDFEFVNPDTGSRIAIRRGEFTEMYPPAWLSTLGTPWPAKLVFIRALRRYRRT